jgi:periplasmic copper chaperone A
MHRSFPLGLAAAFACFAPRAALAHVSIASGPAFADTSGVVVFAVGHGCEGHDTARVDIEIPPGVTSVRPETSGFGQVDVATDDAGTVVLVSFQKPDAAVLAADTQYYELRVRLKVPDAPFTTVHFPAHQTCRAPDGRTEVVDWVGLEPSAADVEPAPALHVLPPRFPGWNKFSVPAAVSDLPAFFSDAQIVWQADAAFSVNPATLELIRGTDGVGVLESLAAGRDIWVKY